MQVNQRQLVSRTQSVALIRQVKVHQLQNQKARVIVKVRQFQQATLSQQVNQTQSAVQIQKVKARQLQYQKVNRLQQVQVNLFQKAILHQ